MPMHCVITAGDQAIEPTVVPCPMRSVKMLMNTARPHNQRDAEKAAGVGAPDNGPKLRSSGGVEEMAQ